MGFLIRIAPGPDDRKPDADIFTRRQKSSLCPDCGWVGFLWGDYSMGEGGCQLENPIYDVLFLFIPAGIPADRSGSFPSGQFPSPAHL